ncbi:MAG: hypothetical protein VKQ33_15960 [Candidatus Sericytochromatia bacterium]|nr:hypothetical protein [Candidatus Sericytochromatia bacterium]
MTDHLNPGPHHPAESARQPAVPEHVWYDAAIDALGKEDAPGARLAALRMLRHAPRSWDAVMVVALTARDEDLQVAAVEALACQAQAEPARRAAYERLGRLHVWSEAARAAWLAGWQALAEGAEPGLPPAPLAAEEEPSGLARQLEAERLERTRLAQEAEASRQEAERLRAELAALRVTCLEVETRLAAQVEAAGRLERGLEEARASARGERESYRRTLEEREADLEGLTEAAWRKERLRRRWVVVAAGGSLLAAGIIAAVVAARAPALAVEPGPKLLAASEAEGYRQALVALAAEASRLEADGDRVAATCAWRNIAAISNDSGLSAHAAQRLDELRQADGGGGHGEPGGGPAPTAARVEAFRAAPVVQKPVTAPARQPGKAARRGPAAPPRRVERQPQPRAVERGAVPLEPGDAELVPADVRAKILELP